MLNEKLLMNILKNNTESVIGFTNDELTEVLIADNTFMLIVNIDQLKQNGALMHIVNKAKLAMLSVKNVVDRPTWSINNNELYKRKVTDYFRIFENMEKLKPEKAQLLPFSVKIVEETTITEQVLFINDNNDYTAFNADYFNIFKNSNNLKNGLLLSTCGVINKKKKKYSFLINNSDCKFLVMALQDVNPMVLQFLATKK